MQAITTELAALLKSTFQAGASGFRARVEVDRMAGVPITCSTAVGSAVGASITDQNVTTSPYSLSVTPAGHSAVFAAFVAGGTGMTLSGVTTTLSVANTGHETSAHGWAVASTTATVSASYTPTSAHEAAAMAAIRTDATAPLQTAVFGWANWGTATLPSPPTPGNMLVAILTASMGATPATVAAPAGWTRLAEGQANGVHPFGGDCVDVFVKCSNGSDGSFGYTGYSIITLMEWPVTGTAGTSVVTQTLHPKRVSIDKSLRMVADQAEVEFANEALPLGWGPTSVFPTNSRCRVYQWYGDEANAVLSFTGVVDRHGEGRDLLSTAVTCRDMMAVLIDQTFGATAPQGAGEDGAVRTAANGVYLSMEVSDVVSDILDRAGWPSADRAITETSYTLDEYIVPDGQSWADAIIGDDRLGGLVGYDAWADESGIFHFAPTYSAGALTDPGVPVYTFQTGVDIVSLADETDQYDLRTRCKIRGPLTTTTLTDTWREEWRTSKFAHPVGIWWDPSDSGNVRVLDRGTKRLYRLRQSDRAVLSSVYLGSVIGYPLGVSGDPSDSTVYWVLNAPWLWGSGTASSVKKVRKADNVVLASYTLSTDHWSAVKASGAWIYLTNLTTDRVYRRSKSDGSAHDSFNHVYGGATQLNPSGIMVDGTTVDVFWSNSGTTARFLRCAESAPGTVTKVIKTAGTALHGGEMDTATHAHCWGDADDLGLVAKFTLLDATSQTDEVFAEVVDSALEDELGSLAQSEPRSHDTHPADADHAFEVRRDTLDVTSVVSLAQATETAMRRLDRLSVRRRVLDVGVIGNPGLQKTDLVRVEDPVTGLADDWLIDTYRSEMSADGTYLGTLALLPVAQPDDTPTDDGSAS